MSEKSVRVVAPLPDKREGRSAAEQIRDEILGETAERLQIAIEQTEQALELFELLAVPQHKNLPILLNQQLEQVVEFRRVRQ